MWKGCRWYRRSTSLRHCHPQRIARMGYHAALSRLPTATLILLQLPGDSTLRFAFRQCPRRKHLLPANVSTPLMPHICEVRHARKCPFRTSFLACASIQCAAPFKFPTTASDVIACKTCICLAGQQRCHIGKSPAQITRGRSVAKVTSRERV